MNNVSENRPSSVLRAVQVFLLVLIVIGTILLLTQKIWLAHLVSYLMRNDVPPPSVSEEIVPPTTPAYLNIAYEVDGISVKLTDGIHTQSAAQGSTGSTRTRYFGNDVKKDLDGDGDEDIAFLLTHEAGGSGTFFYVVAALKESERYTGSKAFLLGDRIAPQTTESGPGNSIVVNYAERKSGEPMSASPSVGKSARLLFDSLNMQFGVVLTDFEGEADPNSMSLSMKTWEWVSMNDGQGEVFLPKVSGSFALTFDGEGGFSAKTDCNTMGGAYSANDTTLRFTDIVSTKMYCEGSQESVFAQLLLSTRSYRFTSKGELLMSLERGEAVFR